MVAGGGGGGGGGNDRTRVVAGGGGGGGGGGPLGSICTAPVGVMRYTGSGADGAGAVGAGSQTMMTNGPGAAMLGRETDKYCSPWRR